MTGTDADDQLGERSAVAVVPCVVGHHSLDANDAQAGEVVDGTSEESSSGVGAFVVEDLRVGDPTVIVDERVDVIETDAGTPQSSG